MTLSHYQCTNCEQTNWQIDSTSWRCVACGQQYPCVESIPKLYVERILGQHDRQLRDEFYGGGLGAYYQQVMPFLAIPARPVRISWKGWIAYFLIVAVLLLAGYVVASFAIDRHSSSTATLGAVVLLGVMFYLFYRHPYLFYLLVLAIPVKISIALKNFKPAASFLSIHESLITELLHREERLEVLDIATGSCNSLFRHGWMKLNAHYTGLDLSETMLLQGRRFMSLQQIPMDFVLADAAHLPFKDGTFDVVLNYGAVNGFSDPRRALEEMARVARKGGVVLFLDEQLYRGASFVEKWYFEKVLSNHNVIHRCPVEWIPASLTCVQVHQVYQFYYLCLCRKE